jgi:hypothetical protein
LGNMEFCWHPARMLTGSSGPPLDRLANAA